MNATAATATDAVRVIQSRRGLQVASVARYQVTKYVVEEVLEVYVPATSVHRLAIVNAAGLVN